MSASRSGLLLALLLGLSACVQNPPSTAPEPAGSSTNHPHFAPPPGLASQWVPALGVYRITGEADVYYRARTFYRFAGAWSWATAIQGPWTATDSSGVPPALSRYYVQ